MTIGTKHVSVDLDRVFLFIGPLGVVLVIANQHVDRHEAEKHRRAIRRAMAVPPFNARPEQAGWPSERGFLSVTPFPASRGRQPASYGKTLVVFSSASPWASRQQAAKALRGAADSPAKRSHGRHGRRQRRTFVVSRDGRQTRHQLSSLLAAAGNWHT